MKKPKTRRRGRRKTKTPLRRLRLYVRRRWRRYRWWLLLALVVGSVCLLRVGLHSKPSTVERTTTPSKHYNGIDVSKYQGNVDWQKVATDPCIQFVYLKATEGATKVDSRYKEYLRKARAQGLKVGSYHFFVSFRTAEEQFDNFCRTVPRDQQDLIPMVDVEEAGNRTAEREKLQQELQRFMDLVRQEYGHYPVLYSQYRFYNDLLAPEFNRYLIFIARYSKQTPQLSGGGQYNIWQFTEKGHIKGIKGSVDLDRFAEGTTLSDISM